MYEFYIYLSPQNEDVFLNQFYQSSAYKKLLLELEFCGHTNEPLDLDSNLSSLNISNFDANSDSNSGDITFEEDATVEEEEQEVGRILHKLNNVEGKFLDVGGSFKHSRSHSDCTGLVQNVAEIVVGPFQQNSNGGIPSLMPKQKTETLPNFFRSHSPQPPGLPIISTTVPLVVPIVEHNNSSGCEQRQKIFAKIINTAIHCEGQYAVYAIQVSVIEENQHKSWHIYRRYSKFLELKKMLVKRVSIFQITKKLEILMDFFSPLVSKYCSGTISSKENIPKY